MANLEQFGKAFFPEQPKTVHTCFGTVQSVNADGSYQVKLNSAGNTRCARLCNAAAGDAVFVVVQENGKCAAVGKVGGESSGGGNTYALQGSGAVISLIENGTTPAGTATIPDATTSAKGVTQLDSATDSASESKAATSKAVSDALTAAKAYAKDYTDEQIVAAGAVTGVKGSAQEDYQHGNVSLSYSDVGAASSSHTHAASAITSTNGNVQTDLNSLSTAIAGKAAASHTHSISNITNLQTTLNGKAATSHTHTIANVTGLQDALDGKAATSHTHDSDAIWYDSDHEDTVQDVLDALDTAIGTKANANHTHAISGVTGLQDALNGKAASNHAHGNVDKDGIIDLSQGSEIASGDRLVISVDAEDGKVDASTLYFGTGATTFLANNGTWQTPAYPTAPTQLYNNSTGTDGTVTLSQSAAGFNHMRIFFKKNGDTNACGSAEVYQPNGKSASLVLFNTYSGGMQFIGKVVAISGTSITKTSEGVINYGGSFSGSTSESSLYIYRVEAW